MSVVLLFIFNIIKILRLKIKTQRKDFENSNLLVSSSMLVDAGSTVCPDNARNIWPTDISKIVGL